MSQLTTADFVVRRKRRRILSRATYERLRPLIVWLGLVEVAWLAYWLLAGGPANAVFRATVATTAALLFAWMSFVGVAGNRGFFLAHTRQLSNHVGLSICLGIAVVPFLVVPAAREGVIAAVGNVSDAQFAVIHILRLLAIGTVIKYLHGELPRSFLILGSLPDLAFGLSAVVVTALLVSGPLDVTWLAVWHALGCAAFLGAGVAMYFSVPSMFQLFDSKPDTSIVFKFPMLLAPNFTVPLFMVAHVLALVKLMA